ncbi:ferritin-like domain-containing protein [Micromonospora sp. C95]|nr:ferritin-like domain-containing protein [Micromonospora sp. C95]
MDVDASVVTRFTWDYESKDAKLRELYEKAKSAQWDAQRDIDWGRQITYGAPLAEPTAVTAELLHTLDDSPVPPELRDAFRWEYHAWMTSQFLHGEQGALMATARLVETVPDVDAKLYAASQVADEARHVEAFARYQKQLGVSYPVNPALSDMLASVIGDSRWDVIYLGNQIIVEGLALAAFRLRQASSFDPTIKQIIDLVARDESRHVAFGVLALRGLYDDMTSRELHEREEFVMESSLLMARRFQLTEIWDRMDLDVEAGIAYTQQDEVMLSFRRLMFTKIIANLDKLSLLTPRVRRHLQQLSLMR